VLNHLSPSAAAAAAAVAVAAAAGLLLLAQQKEVEVVVGKRKLQGVEIDVGDIAQVSVDVSAFNQANLA
jgi:hypothetical protein